MITTSMKKLVAALLLAGAAVLAVGSTSGPASAAEPAAQKPAARPAAQPAPLPQACADKQGVERKICVECDGVSLFKRIGCQQRVFWTTCKGKRLFEDSYCQMHQDQGPPRGENN